MHGGGLKKNFSAKRISALKAEPLFQLLAHDVADGVVFPAVRDDEMHFYYEGARLLSYKSAFVSHSRYQCNAASVEEARKVPAKYVPLNMPHSLEKTYSTLKESCARYREHDSGKRKPSELKLVAEMYRHLSHARRVGGPTLLDVEICFPKSGNRTSDIVDMLFVLPRGKLCFVEAKRTGDPRARSKTKPEVAQQILNYEERVKAADHIVETYSRVQEILAELFDCPVTPLRTVFHKVPLLILDTWKRGADECWQRDRINPSGGWKLEDDFILIHGEGTPWEALKSFLLELDRRLA